MHLHTKLHPLRPLKLHDFSIFTKKNDWKKHIHNKVLNETETFLQEIDTKY